MVSGKVKKNQEMVTLSKAFSKINGVSMNTV
jgi:hypothetical protein